MKLKSSKSISYKKTISNPNDFSQNYQQASNNYTNLVKFYNNSIQIHDAIEKIINSYKEGVSIFKKKLIQIKSSLIKPFYNEQTQSYKFDEKIYVNNNSYIYKLNQIINFQIDALTNMINDIEQNLFLNTEKKTIVTDGQVRLPSTWPTLSRMIRSQEASIGVASRLIRTR